MMRSWISLVAGHVEESIERALLLEQSNAQVLVSRIIPRSPSGPVICNRGYKLIHGHVGPNAPRLEEAAFTTLIMHDEEIRGS